MALVAVAEVDRRPATCLPASILVYFVTPSENEQIVAALASSLLQWPQLPSLQEITPPGLL
ncbi:MAG: hypothetical protein IT318_10840 [Anaerolineales bacterium]|nr:hypothetical protein [Anaerolineales bacterium]